MELHQLRCFAAAVEQGGFKRATTQLSLTQPALSYQIKRLEEELGVLLFHRRPTGVTPTQTGRVLYEYAREIIEADRRAKRAVQELAGGIAGEIRIGTVNSVGIYFLPKVLRRMKAKYPTIQPSVVYRSSKEIIEALLSDQVDVALAANPLQDRRLKQQAIIEEQFSLVCGRSHPFYSRKQVKPSELNGLEFVCLTADNPTGELVANHLARIGVRVRQVVGTDNLETAKKLVQIGLGLSFLPDMVINQELCPEQPPNAPCVLKRIEVAPRLTRRIAVVTWRKLEPSRAVGAFLEELRISAAALRSQQS